MDICPHIFQLAITCLYESYCFLFINFTFCYFTEFSLLTLIFFLYWLNFSQVPFSILMRTNLLLVLQWLISLIYWYLCWGVNVCLWTFNVKKILSNPYYCFTSNWWWILSSEIKHLWPVFPPNDTLNMMLVFERCFTPLIIQSNLRVGLCFFVCVFF